MLADQVSIEEGLALAVLIQNVDLNATRKSSEDAVRACILHEELALLCRSPLQVLVHVSILTRCQPL